MDRAKQRVKKRKLRAARVKKKILGTAECPRLSIRRSLNHISAQIVDDVSGKSIAQVSSAAKDVIAKIDAKKSTKTDASKVVGELIAERAKAIGVSTVVFDRKGYVYHGRVKALADAARSAGLVF